MRILVIILALAATPATAAMLWMRAHPQPPAPTIPVHSVVWADRVFMSPAELRRWLRNHGERYKTWARKHPTQAAALEHRPLPSKRTAVRKAAPAAPPSERDTSSGSKFAFLALLLALASTATLAFRARRRLRVPRPQVTLPAVDLDLRSAVHGVGRHVARLGRRPPRTATPAPQPSTPIGLSDRSIALSPHPAGNGSFAEAVRVLDPTPALSLEPTGSGAIASALPVAGPAVAVAPEPAGNGSPGEPDHVSGIGVALSSAPPVNRSLAEAAPVSEEAASTSPEPSGNGSVGDATYPSDQSVIPLHPEINGSLEEVPSVSEEDAPTPSQPAGDGSPGDAAPGGPRSSPADSSRKRGRAAPEPPAPAVEPEASALAEVRPIGTEADAGAIVQPVLPEPDAVPTAEWELCTTACWRGYLSARFYAHPPGDTTAIKESVPFDWWGWQPDPKDRDAAQAALDELCGLLQAEGWEPFARGDAWYEVRFRRRPRMEW